MEYWPKSLGIPFHLIGFLRIQFLLNELKTESSRVALLLMALNFNFEITIIPIIHGSSCCLSITIPTDVNFAMKRTDIIILLHGATR